MVMKKIGVVGGGHVGATTAQRVAEKELCEEVILIDILEGVPMGKALDQWQSAPVELYDTRIIGANDYAAAEGAEMFIVTAGKPRTPGMSRDDLVSANVDIVKSVSEQIKKVAPDSMVIVVSNPLDVMCYVAKEVTGFPKERVVGMAGILDTARFRAFLADAADCSVEDIQAMVLGGHGDSMVPLISYTTVSGIPITQLVGAEELEAIVKRTRGGGGEIVKLLGTGSAYYAPSAGAVQMADAIIKNKKRILPCSAWLEGEYGMNGLYVGVPCKLGENGIEKIVEVELSADEQAALEKSGTAVKDVMDIVKL
jgi:malate dehydrogenase